MPTTDASSTWGAWTLGDLSDASRVVSELLGSSASVTSIKTTAPDPMRSNDELVTITVVTRSEMHHRRLCRAVAAAGYVLDEVWEPTSTHWSGVVGHFYLVLMVEEVA